MKSKKNKILRKTFPLFALFSMLLINLGSNSIFIMSNNKDYKTNNKIENDEILEYRSEYEKHFRNEDGTITATTYADPIHYKDKKGNWVDINNTLIGSNSSNKSGYKTFSNQDSPLKIILSEESTTENLVNVKVDDYELSWGIENASNVKGIVDNNLDTKTNDIKTLSTISSKIAYNDLFDNTTLKYTLSSYALIEELIFEKIPLYDNIIYNVNTKNLKAKLVNQEVIFYDEKNESKEIFKFTVPFMYDSAENPQLNLNVGVTLEGTEQGYIVKHILDMDWLKDESRVYPVVLDPVVTSYQHYSNISDTHTNSNSPNTNYMNNPYLQIGKINGTNYVYVKIINMPSLPTGSEITDARLGLFLNYGTGTWGPYSIFELRNNWASSTLTWNNQGTLVNNAPLISNGIYPIASGGYHKYNIDVTSTVKKWYSGTLANNGFMLRYQDVNYNDCNWIYASDNLSIGSTYLPAITVTYNTNPTTAYADMNWHYPLPTNHRLITQGWHANHHAIDISATIGQPLYAVDSGKVVSILIEGAYPIGNAIAIETNSIDLYTGKKLVASYGHLNSIAVSLGQTITKGQIIGYSGNTGNTGGPHLHFEVQRNGSYWATHNPAHQNNSVDPRLFWPGL